MKETDLQSLTIKAVRLYGGAAHKLSNRFLVGVSDLLVKLPKLPAALLEVKYDERADMPVAGIVPDVTVLQYKFLKEYHDAGMRCGVMSFLYIKEDKMLHAQIAPLPRYQRGDSLNPREYWQLGLPADRLNVIKWVIDDFVRNTL